jgi:cobalamin biosynthesis protein CobD/CbiB
MDLISHLALVFTACLADALFQDPAYRLHPIGLLGAWSWSEAACAGALRVGLIGPISYRGRVVNEAFMGDEGWPADLDGSHLEQALRLILVCSLLALVLGLGLILVAHELLT